MSSPIDITPACECGALLHPGETCEAALACLEAMLAGCTCGGHYDAAQREVLHDPFCDGLTDGRECACGFGCPAFMGCRAYDEQELSS